MYEESQLLKTNTMEEIHTILLAPAPLLLLLALTFSLLLLFLLKPRNSNLPPGPNPWPIVGNLLHLTGKPHRRLTELSRIYGPIMSLKLGFMPTIVISSPEIAKQMFLHHDLDFSGRNVPAGGKVSDHHQFSVGWLPVCPKWRTLRKIATVHLFTAKSLAAGEDLRREVVEKLIGFTRECCKTGRPVEISKTVFVTSINLLSNTLFSMDLASYGDSNPGGFEEILWEFWEAAGKPNLADAFPAMGWLDYLQGGTKRVGECFDKIFRVFEEIIEGRIRVLEGFRDDGLGKFLKLVEDNEWSLDDVKHFLFDLFIAGTDTTSTTLEWAMTELLRHPEKIAKAQREIGEIMDNNDMSVRESDISKLPYIQAIVKETLRMYPPAPFLLPRKAEKDVQFCGYLVPKNAQIWVNVWAMGRDPSVWSDPESFSPERFLERKFDAKGRDFEFIPFGEGRRICLGMPLAYSMLHLMLANLLHSFNWKPSDGISPKDVGLDEKFGIVMQKNPPLEAIPLAR